MIFAHCIALALLEPLATDFAVGRMLPEIWGLLCMDAFESGLYT